MADHDPQDDTVFRQPASPRLATREQLVGSSSPHGPLTAEEAALVAGAAAPISAQEIVTHLRAIASTAPGQQSLWDCTVAAWAADAIEALTAENARPTSENTDIRSMIADPQAVHLGMLRGGIAKPSLRNMLHLHGDEAIKRWDAADALKAEVERLTALMTGARALVKRGAVRAWNDTHYRTEPMSEDRKRVIETNDMFRQAMDLLDQGAPTDHDWYDTQRAKVEADAVAAKIGQQQ